MRKSIAKALSVLLIGAMVLSGCSGNNNTGTNSTSNSSSTSSSTDTSSTSTETTTTTETAPTETASTDTTADSGDFTYPDYGNAPALVLGSTEFNGVFSTFFGTTAYDMEIADDLVGDTIITNDRFGAPVENVCTYTAEEIKDASGNITETVYTFTIKDGVKFSDNTPVTADDIIFTYKVLCDPTYDGSSTIYTSPILGVNEYRYDDNNYSAKIEELKTQSQNVTDEEIKAFIRERSEADVAAYSAEDIMGYTKFTNENNLEGEELTKALVDAYYEVEVKSYYDDYKGMLSGQKFTELEKEYIQSNLSSGTANVPEIAGIKKIDDKTVSVTIAGVDPKAIWNLGGITIAPEHYYSVDNSGNTFKKGDLTAIRSKNGAPVGCGPYRFIKFENNVVSLEANSLYFKGEPETKKIKYQVMANANKLESIKLGETDVSDPNATLEMVKDVEDAGMHYSLIENLGYGYIGINADRVTDKNVRKGLMHLMNRAPAVNTYYGELASVIERPMSKVSWAYPQDAKEYYGFSSEKALECFLAAGYTQEQKDGKNVLTKDGQQLRVEIAIGGDGTMDHPSAPVLTVMKTELEKLGGILDINDCDVTILFDTLDAGGWDMWVAAWQATIDPDMYQTYYSTGPSNHYRIRDDKLDSLIFEARQTNDVEVRKAKYFEALDIIMDWAVEMPVYQRKNMIVFNPEIIDINTLAADMTPFYGWLREVEKLQLMIK